MRAGRCNEGLPCKTRDMSQGEEVRCRGEQEVAGAW